MKPPRHPAQVENRLRVLTPLNESAEAIGALAPLFATVEPNEANFKAVRASAAAVAKLVAEVACADYDQGKEDEP